MTAPSQQPPPPGDSHLVEYALAGIAAWQLTSNFAGMLTAIRSRVIEFVTRLWQSLGSYDSAAVDRAADTVVSAVEAGQAQVSQLTDTYLRSQYAQMTHTPVESASLSEVPAYADMRRGMDPLEVYRRPGEQTRYALSRGLPVDEAAAIGQRRLTDLVGTDLQLAQTHTAARVLPQQRRVVGFRRVLTGPTSCGLCIVASTQRYHRGDLLPIHPNCDCVVAPMVGDHDPGRALNSATLAAGAAPVGVDTRAGPVYHGNDTVDLGDLLEPAHEAIAQRFGVSYRDAATIDYSKVMLTHQHGEIGPVLAVQGHKFTRRQIARNDLRRTWK